MTIRSIEELNKALMSDMYDVEYVRATSINLNTIIDEDKSVRWNIDEAHRINEESRLNVERYRREKRLMDLKLEEDIARAYSSNSGYSHDKIKILYDYAYEQSHSSGINEVLQTLEELIELLKKTDYEH